MSTMRISRLQNLGFMRVKSLGFMGNRKLKLMGPAMVFSSDVKFLGDKASGWARRNRPGPKSSTPN